MRERTYVKPKKVYECVVTNYGDLMCSVNEYIRHFRSYEKTLGGHLAILVDFQNVFKDNIRYNQLIYRCKDGRYRKFITSCEFVEGSIKNYPAKIRIGEFHERAKLMRDSEACKYYHLPALI